MSTKMFEIIVSLAPFTGRAVKTGSIALQTFFLRTGCQDSFAEVFSFLISFPFLFWFFMSLLLLDPSQKN